MTSKTRPIDVPAGTRRAAAAAAAFLSVWLLIGGPVPLAAQAGGGLAQREVVVDSLAVEGNQRLSRSQVLGSTTLRLGVPITGQDVQTAIKDLWDTGEFEDVQVYATGSGDLGDPVVLTYQVEERDLVRYVDIRGLENLDADAVQDTANLRAGQPYSATRVDRARRFIRTELASEGIPFARIDERREPIPDAPNEIRLILDVTEGNRVTVAAVEILGNERFQDQQIVASMMTGPEGFWWFGGGEYDQESFRSDVEQGIPRFYRGRGYLDAAVVDDTLVVDPQTGKARAEITVDEGPQYRVADFVIEGNQEFDEAELRQYFQQEGGGLLSSLGFGNEERERDPVFDEVRFQNATTEVQRLYNNNGYLYAQVRPFIEPLSDREEDGQPRVRVGWEIQEGNPAYVDEVAIVGNDYTYERVIRDRILLLPGDIYSEDRLLQSYQQIQALGFFVTPMDPPDIQPDPETGDVDITFMVEERQTGSVSFGTAVGGGTGLSGFLGYDQPNLFGQAKSGSLRWDFGRFVNSFTTSYSDPALLGSRISGQLSLFNARDRFFSFQTGERRRLGATTQFGIPIPSARFTRFSVGYSISRTEYRLREGVEDTSLFGRAPGTQSTLIMGLTRTTLNHPVFPTQGSRQSLTFDLNGGPLGGDGDFVKQVMEGTWWVPVGTLGGNDLGTGGVRLALGLTLEAGAVYGDASNFPFERFWMGGVQFGESLRGYDETSITPLGYFPENSRAIRAIDRLGDAYFRLSAEYAIRLSDNISASLFYDAGSVWQDPREVNPGRLFRGAGVGVQLVTPFGPLGLDYGYGFDKTEPGWQLAFRMGGMGL